MRKDLSAMNLYCERYVIIKKTGVTHEEIFFFYFKSKIMKTSAENNSDEAL